MRCRTAELRAGPLRYRELGSGEPVVFLHGVLTNGALWRKVMPLLADGHRCIAPDLPLGAHALPMRAGADLSPPGLAALVVELLDELGLDDATVVGNDTGGAIAQLLAADRPERVRRLVLTSCDAFDNFPPPLLRPAKLLGRAPWLMFAAGQLLRPLAMQRLAFRWSAKRPLPAAVHASYSRHGLRSYAVVRDLASASRRMEAAHTLRAATALRSFDRPALVVWAAEDRFFPPDHGRRLAALLPHGRFELVEDSYTFISEDQPERLAELLGEFAAANVVCTARGGRDRRAASARRAGTQA